MPVAEFKSPAGLIRVELEISEDKIDKVSFSGDFFFYPEKDLEKFEVFLEGAPIDEESLRAKIQKFYRSEDIETPALEIKHWVKAIKKARGRCI